MKKVMLVDDEILIRETMRDSIDWEKEGFVYCDEAPDGEVALTLIEQLRPDILITDIKMPFMNGLELSAIVCQRYPEIKIVILSGYEDFEFARSALRMGVVDYCLKPISASELLRLLHRVSESIDKERGEKANAMRLQEVTQEKLLNDLCSGFMTTTDAVHLSSALSLSLLARFYIVAMAHVRDAELVMADAADDASDAAGPVPALRKLTARTDVLQFKRSRSETVWLLKASTLEELHRELLPFKELQSLAADTDRLSEPACPVSVGIGSMQDRLQGVHLSFLDAAQDMHWRRLSGQNRLTMRQQSAEVMEQFVLLDRKKFVDFMKIGSPPMLSPFVNEYAADLKHIEWTSTPVGYYIINDLTLEVFRSAKDMYRHVEDPERYLRQFQMRIGQIRSHGELKDYLIKLIEQFWNWRSRSNDKYGPIIRKAKDYIQAHFGNDALSLQEVADHVNMNASHLSKVFSQETGQTFIEFLTQTRIQFAMELLKNSAAKTYEIAFQAGYSDPHYFSNLFKRMTGMTTKEFRKSGSADCIGAGSEEDR
ncbi:response regulator transcription factor [Paenibacillus hamazuiensis]|uniref:response regulator transcription factor n=1 Tax=Paenibacillus hamazuiensis TaxID=2936508 RepID=UPI00200D7566|nr:response regulator [Paenibacillus hamazuiensis]